MTASSSADRPGPARVDVGFVGLGSMGTHLAGHLLDDGHTLAVFDSRAEAVEPFAERGALACGSPAEVGDAAAVVLVSLPTPHVVESVACGPDGVIHGSAVRTFVDLSTTGAVVAQRVAQAFGEAGIGYLDSPVSGGVGGARARSLAIMAAGAPEVFERTRPLLDALGANVFWVGPEPGEGQLAKLLNNLLSATALAITSEAMAFGVKAGLNPRTLLEIFNASSGRNTATSDKFPQQVLTREFDMGFRLELMTKDVELCLAEARLRGIPMVLGGTVQQLWTLAAAQAGDGADASSIAELFEEWVGVTIEEREPDDGRG